ncbi:MAG: protoheme IX farnesyltransferase [Oceanospirillaceae bacterium]|nr:protoheme IX farnesyltransferase [Oceanospirillaceae bacterium]
MFKHYLVLTKPGIIFGNLVAGSAGFFMAAKGDIDWLLFLVTMLGIALIIASGCVYNNYIDRDIDSLMQRTLNRPLVKKLVPLNIVLIYATILGLAGFTLLSMYTNWLAFTLGVIGFVVYVGLYSMYFKRKSVYGTAIGSLSGACPPVIGYCAITNQFDSGAMILLAIFCLWQIPHSYAIAIYRFNDYKAAKIPVLPVTEGIKAARNHIIAYIIAFVIVSLFLTQQNHVGMLYAVAVSVLGMYWLYIAVVKYSESKQEQWGKDLFIFSIVTITCFSILISVDFVRTVPMLAAL